jgi:rfaE bifunctional protein kinase chain/domain
MLPLVTHQLDVILNCFKDLHILVVGDFFLDKYLIIERSLREFSLETGLEAHQIIDVRNSPGAAGTVASNLRALGIQVSALGVIGDDGHGHELKRGLQESGVNATAIIEVTDLFTPTYTKPMIREIDGSVHEIERQDIKNRNPLPSDLEVLIINNLKNLVPQVDGVIIVDQVQEHNCGVITDRVRSEIGFLATQHPEVVIAVDSRVRIGQYENVILKPNGRELILASQAELPKKIEPENIKPYGHALFSKTMRPVFVTLGEDGILVFTEVGCEHIPAIQVDTPIDVVGAGDSCLAAIVSSLCSGAEPAQAAFMGNVVASITIQQIGTTGTASPTQIQERFHQLEA